MQTSRKLWLGALALAALWAAPAPAQAPKLDPLVPGDAEIVVTFNVRQMLDSPLVKKHALKEMKDALQKNEQVTQALKAVGFDPFKDVNSVVFTGSGSANANKVLAVVRGTFDPDKVHTAVAAEIEKKPGKVKILKEGATRLYEIQAEGKPAYAAFADKGTLVVSPSKEYTLEAVQNAGKKPAKPNKELEQALSKVSGKETLWLAVVVTDEMKKAMAKNPQTANLAPKLESVTGSVNLTENLDATFLIHTTDAKAAAELRKMINQVKPLLAVIAQNNEEVGPVVGELLNNLKITADKTTVDISLKVTDETIEKATKKEEKKEEKK
jgi:hypothetical protein